MLVAMGYYDVISSFAGVTRAPLLPNGRVHVGGFGGADGLADFIRREEITQVIDATHPFAAQMSAHAVAACRQMSVHVLRLERPAWQPAVGDTWLPAANMADAVARIPQGARVLVTTGHKDLAGLLARGDISGVIRTIETPHEKLPPHWHVLLDRPPHGVAAELELMRREDISCLLTKNSGGDATIAKLEAARQSGVTVVMIERPFKPGCPVVYSPEEALLGIRRLAG